MQTIVLSWMLMLGALSGAASNFPVDMFETTSHNFGTVVKGSKTEFDFVFTNRYMEDVVIESVTSSCQCTTPTFAPRGPIKTRQQGRIHISVNTQNFVGNKNATITVRFSRPYRVEMQLHSYVYIRNDVSVNPGIVYFGSVDPTTNPAVKVNVNSVNQGWRILDVQSECKFVAVELKNYPNSPNYTMVVRLRPNAPPGPFSEVLELVTNDNSHIPVRVEGRVKQTLSASPSPLAFNIIEEGRTVEKTIVVQGAEPFTIRDITSENRDISASITHEPKKVQRIKLSYTGNQIGDFNDSITVYTDLEGGLSTSVNFNGKVIPAPKAEPVMPEVTPEVTTREEPKEAVVSEEVAESELPELPEVPEEKKTPEMTVPMKEEKTTEKDDVETLDLLDLPEFATEEPTKAEEPAKLEEKEKKPVKREIPSLQELVSESMPSGETMPLPAPVEEPVEQALELPTLEMEETEDVPDADDETEVENLEDLMPENVPEESEVAPTKSLETSQPAVIGRNLLRKN